MTKTLVYVHGGDSFHGEQELNDYELKQLKQEQKENGVTGYMIGHSYFGNGKQRVIVFFDEKPEDVHAEELRRRSNDFVGAKWHNL